MLQNTIGNEYNGRVYCALYACKDVRKIRGLSLEEGRGGEGEEKGRRREGVGVEC